MNQFAAQLHPPRATPTSRLPSWRVNLLFFGLLILITLTYFLYQLHGARKVFTAHVLEHTRLLAEVIEQQARTSLLSQDVIDEIVGTYLGNTARFVSYLNTIEPFQARELTEFALESGLAGIRILGRDEPPVEGPPGWAAMSGEGCGGPPGKLHHAVPEHLYHLAWLEPGQGRCILVGLAAGRMETLQSHIGIDHLLATLGSMPGIRYARLESPSSLPTGVTLVDSDDQPVAEARLAMEDKVLVVGSDTRFFYTRIDTIQTEFAIFAGILSAVGLALSAILYRHQAAFVDQVRAFDRALAREQQDAVLGRSAAAIAHEIRNPLNAIDMGLQRLQIEAAGLEAEHRDLIRTLREAVARTNGIVTDLKSFAQPLAIAAVPIRPDAILVDLLTLYGPALRASGIVVKTRITCTISVSGARDLMQAALENLLKNAIEAQPQGGDILVEWVADSASGLLGMENGGFTLPPGEVDRIFEPYFTQKTRGTGLGVPIAARIINAHGGVLIARSPAPGRIRIEIRLPLLSAEDRNLRHRQGAAT